MAAKDFDGAIKAYGDAIDIDGQNAVYWSNRWVTSLVREGVVVVAEGRR